MVYSHIWCQQNPCEFLERHIAVEMRLVGALNTTNWVSSSFLTFEKKDLDQPPLVSCTTLCWSNLTDFQLRRQTIINEGARSFHSWELLHASDLLLATHWQFTLSEMKHSENTFYFPIDTWCDSAELKVRLQSRCWVFAEQSALMLAGEKHCWSPFWRKFPGIRKKNCRFFEFEAVNPLVQTTGGSTHPPGCRFNLSHFPVYVYLLRVKHTSALNSQTSADTFVNRVFPWLIKIKAKTIKKNGTHADINRNHPKWGRKSEKFQNHNF